MSRATGIKSPAVLARESRRSGREDFVAHWSNLFATNQHMHPEQCTDHHIQGEHCKAKGSGEKLAEGAHGSVLVLGVKAEPNDDDERGDGKASKNVECGHSSALGFLKQPLNRQAAAVLNSISKASNGGQNKNGDVEEAAHSGHLGGLALGGSAKHRPINVGAEVFAADHTFRGALNGWATLGRYWPITLDPLVDGWRRYANQSSHCGLTSNGHTSPIDAVQMFVHAPMIRLCLILSIGIA